MKRYYRIVRDNFLGYEVQDRYWFSPFWAQTDFCNTFTTVESAERFARSHAEPVKYLGDLRQLGKKEQP